MIEKPVNDARMATGGCTFNGVLRDLAPAGFDKKLNALEMPFTSSVRNNGVIGIISHRIADGVDIPANELDVALDGSVVDAVQAFFKFTTVVGPLSNGNAAPFGILPGKLDRIGEQISTANAVQVLVCLPSEWN